MANVSKPLERNALGLCGSARRPVTATVFKKAKSGRTRVFSTVCSSPNGCKLL